MFDIFKQRVGARIDCYGGIFAGICRGVDGALDYCLYVHPDVREGVQWQPAMDWAEGLIGGENGELKDYSLPTRREQSVLFGNVPELFDQAWYWSCEPDADEPGAAWSQNFHDGCQDFFWKDTNPRWKGTCARARAVRRVPIQPKELEECKRGIGSSPAQSLGLPAIASGVSTNEMIGTNGSTLETGSIPNVALSPLAAPETPRYSFITESDETGMGRIVVEDFRHGKPRLRYFGVPIEVARALSLAPSPVPDVAEIRKVIDVLIRAAWEWGRICETDGVSFNGEGDGYVQWMKSDTMGAKVKLLQTLGIEPAPDAAPKSPSGMRTITYRGSGSDLAKDVLPLLDGTELKRFMECMPVAPASGNDLERAAQVIDEKALANLLRDIRVALSPSVEVEMRDILAPAFEALDKIDADPGNMDIRRQAEVACFYAVQRVKAMTDRWLRGGGK